MPALNHQQFWKGNPNQMALPGMEEHAHPGAKLLSQGIHFEHEALENEGGRGHMHALTAVHGDQEMGYLHWFDRKEPSIKMSPGEISGIETHRGHEGRRVATTLFGLGRTLARVKPRHSTNRTPAGDAWARTTVSKYGARVPKKNTNGDDLY